MRILAGTSGFSYAEWKGSFYPQDLPAREMLGFYAGVLPTVEVNNTFYRMPRRELLERWAGTVPQGFRFAVKAPQRITHRARLGEGSEEAVGVLWSALAGLGEHLGPVLFQMPPTFRLDLERLHAFLALLPGGCRAAFEFRHASWFRDEVLEALRSAGAALCWADSDGGPEPALEPTARWGYLRLRREAYGDADIAAWRRRIEAQPWEEAFVYFKHEGEGVAARRARELGRAGAA